jgi:hypothetical protein
MKAAPTPSVRYFSFARRGIYAPSLAIYKGRQLHAYLLQGRERDNTLLFLQVRKIHKIAGLTVPNAAVCPVRKIVQRMAFFTHTRVAFREMIEKITTPKTGNRIHDSRFDLTRVKNAGP